MNSDHVYGCGRQTMVLNGRMQEDTENKALVNTSFQTKNKFVIVPYSVSEVHEDSCILTCSGLHLRVLLPVCVGSIRVVVDATNWDVTRLPICSGL